MNLCARRGTYTLRRKMRRLRPVSRQSASAHVKILVRVRIECGWLRGPYSWYGFTRQTMPTHAWVTDAVRI